ncbi:MAG: hypothetical protein PHY08_10115 [Candidatus Cloacimonetes bacterium]|nr:hypothetical protein [Candidatus Cloacimonadota bacterium]
MQREERELMARAINTVIMTVYNEKNTPADIEKDIPTIIKIAAAIKKELFSADIKSPQITPASDDDGLDLDI